MKKIVLILTVLTLFSCKTDIKKMEQPNDLIAEDTMVMVLTDLAIMDAHISNKYPLHIIKSDVISNSGDTILANYNIDYKRWKSSMTYYISNQAVLIEINKKVLDALTAKEQALAN